VPTEVFIDLSNRLDEMSRESLPKEQRVECGKQAEHLLDVFFEQRHLTQAAGVSSAGAADKPLVRMTQKLPMDATRVDKVDLTSGNWSASIKRRLGMLDLYTGRRPPEHGPAFDLRAAVSAELPAGGFSPVPGQREEFRRRKLRKSFHFRAWRIYVHRHNHLPGEA